MSNDRSKCECFIGQEVISQNHCRVAHDSGRYNYTGRYNFTFASTFSFGLQTSEMLTKAKIPLVHNVNMTNADDEDIKGPG